MKHAVLLALMLLLILAALPLQVPVQAQGAPQVRVRSLYTLNRYGFATINETVRVTNNGTSAMQPPGITIGLGNLSSKVVATTLSPGFSLGSSPTGGPYIISGSQSIPAGGNATFVLSALANGVVTTAKNGSLEVLTLSTPSISIKVGKLIDVVQMPVSTSLASAPPKLTANILGTNNTYSAVISNVAPQGAVTSVRAVAASSVEDFNPLRVFSAQRTVSASSSGTPVVTDRLQFENLGVVPLAQLHLSLLTPPNTQVTIVTATSTEPVLLAPFKIGLSNGALDLAAFVVGYPSDGVQSGTNFTLTYQYPLGSNYYTVSGDQVTANIPETPPVAAFIDAYSIGISPPQGGRLVQGGSTSLGAVTPWQMGSTALGYSLSPGWFIEAGIPAASVMFVLILVGLFVAKTTAVEEIGAEAEEEESSSEQASSMIKAFDEKTTVINGLWQEIESKDPNELDKGYFDELRGRLDAFRGRALQRLNDVKQRSTSQKFFEVVNQIQATEREVDRAAKDKLNLYQQYYLRQMRKEVYDRLLPQYTKRLERALNQLSDELHTVQREAKLL